MVLFRADQLADVAGTPLSVVGYRNQANGFEFTRQAQRQSLTVDDLLPRELWRLTVELTKVLDLTNPAAVQALGVRPADLVRDDRRLTREIGEAAHAHHFQAIRSASATGVDEVVAILPENLAGAALTTDLIEEWVETTDVS